MTRHLCTLSLALLATSFALAAPVPAQRLVTAEAIVAPPKGNPREVASRLMAREILAGVARSQVNLPCLRGERDSLAWLTARLSTTVDEKRGTIRLRLIDCPKADAVTLLAAVIESYRSMALQDLAGGFTAQQYEMVQLQGQAQIQVQVQFLRAARVQRMGRGGILVDHETAGPDNRSLREAVNRTVIQAPRIVPAEVFRRDRPGQ